MKSMTHLVLFAVLVVIFVSETLTQTTKKVEVSYIGDSACALCHKIQSESFHENKHNNAYTDIVENEQFLKLMKTGEEGSCSICHATGYMKKGGFVNEETTPEFAKVGCEGCHGPGSVHIAVTSVEKEMKRKTIKRKPDCGTCHKIHSHEG